MGVILFSYQAFFRVSRLPLGDANREVSSRGMFTNEDLTVARRGDMEVS